MKRRRVLPLSDSLKLNDIGTRRNDASSSICYPRQACHPKIIGVLARDGGGNKGTVTVVIGSMSLLNMALFAFVSGWGHLISFHFLPPWVWVILFGHSSAHCPFIVTPDHLIPKYCQIRHSAADMFKRSWPLQVQSPSDTSRKINLSLPVSRRWCGKHYGPPSIKITSCRLQLIIQESDLETPFWYLGACMPQWQVLRVRREVFIIGLRSNDSAGVQHRLIHSHAVDCTYSTLRTIVIIGGPSRVC